jgi:hypothetical protein
MTVKDLIQHLAEWDPNAEVRIGSHYGAIDWSIKGISVYILSPSDDQYCVYLGCKKNQYQVDTIPQTSPFLEKTNVAI